ncbi:hypothetical protein C8J57DRAFT_1480807 [Mycena rebaudengoi]|nr:hypothetical protein C8J57DRAFT_1480807 [Mycena rebaudengoi]
MSVVRKVAVDDTDPAIRYGANGWFVVDAASLNVGNFGPIYNATSHGTSTSGSSFTFPFDGTSITVLGTIFIATDANNATDPTWDCFVDKVKIASPNPTFKFPENNWVLCDAPELLPGSHVLSVTVQSKGKTFFLDQLTYTPPSGAAIDSAVLIYPNTDPAVSYGSGWGPLAYENITQSKGAQVALNFFGTSVSLFGFIPTELPHDPASASYTIDGGQPVTFPLDGLSSKDSATSYNHLFFQTPTLKPAFHNLVITHDGDQTKTPLVVASFYVTNGTISKTTATSPDSPASSAGSPRTTHSSTAAIVGGTIGCLALLVIIAGLAFWCRKRRRRVAELKEHTSPEPFPMSHSGDAAYPVTAAGAPPPSVAAPGSGSPYGYSAVPATGYPYSYPAAASSGVVNSGTQSHGDVSSGRNNNFPYAHTPLSLPSTDATSAHGTHSRGPSSSNSQPVSQPSAEHGHDPVAAVGYPRIPSDHGSQGASRKVREAAANAAPERPVVLRHHQDSGVRLPPPQPGQPPEVVELPPGYTPD